MSDRALLEKIYQYWLEFRSDTTTDHRFAFCNHMDEIMYEYDRTRMAEPHSNPYRDIILGFMVCLRTNIEHNRIFSLKDLKQMLYNYEHWDKNIQNGIEHFTFVENTEDDKNVEKTINFR